MVAAKKSYHRLYYQRNKAEVSKKTKAYFVANREASLAKQAAYRKTPHAKTKRRYLHLEEKYGVTQELYEAQFKAQAGDCCICKKPWHRILHVDHDHATGRFRGLLCGPCNLMLGAARDSQEILAEAIRYLSK